MSLSSPNANLQDAPIPMRKENVEHILPLLPLQSALVLHSETVTGEDPGFIQVLCRVEGSLEIETFRKAWQQVMESRAALRMSLHAKAGTDPMTVIWKELSVPWSYSDLRASEDPEAALAESVIEDRKAGLDPSSPPVMRVQLLQLAERSYELIWTCHHLFVDGWSAAIVLEDLLDAYQRLHQGDPSLPTTDVSVLRQYFSLISNQDEEGAESYWSERLRGFDGAPPLQMGHPGSVGMDRVHMPVASGVAELVKAAAAELALTVNAFVQGAWALTLAELFKSKDVVFGTTVSGRSNGIPGMERAVGYFANVVPVRVAVDGASKVGVWLRELRDGQFRQQPFEHSMLADIHAWSGLPGRTPLFESFVVVENFPVQQSESGDADDVTISSFRSDLTTAYPLTLALGLGDEWFVECRFDQQRMDKDAVTTLLDRFTALLGALAANASGHVSQIAATAAGDPVEGLLTAEITRDRPPVKHQPPRNDTERALARVWEQVLGIEAIGVHDDYFELGGTSLLALRLFGYIQREMGVTLPLRTLLRAPTISQLAEVIDPSTNPDAEKMNCLVEIQRGDPSRKPIICVHGGRGNVLFYRELARRLGFDQPVYGLEPVGLDGKSIPLETVQDMAERYISELRHTGHAGPYQLVGYCFGGSVALEMAHQLEKAGQVVETVTVIDAGLPRRLTVGEGLKSSQGRLARLLAKGGPLAIAKAVLVGARRRSRWWDGFSGPDPTMAQQRVANANRRAFKSFEPKATSANLTLVLPATVRQSEGLYWHNEWEAYAASVEIVEVDASHESIMREPAVGQVANAVLESFAK